MSDKEENRPIPLEPYCRSCIWGGDRLARLYVKRADIPTLGETWECSAHPAGQSVASDGAFVGQRLGDILAAHPSMLGVRAELPILIKLIDAREDLSVQVHPDNEYAVLHEGQSGKTEMWYILEAPAGAQLTLGLNRPLTREQLRDAALSDDIEEYLRHVSVKRGDAFLIEPGTIHAIGAGVLLAEIQQNSDVTYRLWDYGRVDSSGRRRELHLDAALDVAVLDGRPVSALTPTPLADGLYELCTTHAFRVLRLDVHGFRALPTEHGAASALLCIEGEGRLEFGTATDDTRGAASGAAADDLCAYSVSLRSGSCVFLPAGCESPALTGRCACLLVSF